MQMETHWFTGTRMIGEKIKIGKTLPQQKCKVLLFFPILQVKFREVTQLSGRAIMAALTPRHLVTKPHLSFTLK